MTKVVICAGPTASGKSSFAYKLAQSQNGEILNGDSLQVYKGLEILTAQPSLLEQQSIPHHLYGILDPQEACSAGKWFSLIIPEIEKILEMGKLPIVVGGTGLYLKALCEGISPIPPIDPNIREELQKRPDSVEILYEELKTLDPALCLRLKIHDHQRILRGLEVFYGTGKPLSFWQSQKPFPAPYEFEKILLMPPKEDLSKRIENRLEEMLERGVLDEIERLLPLQLSPTAMKAIGFKEFKGFLEGECSLEEAKELTLIHTRQYAKRQRTWFRHQFTSSFL